MEIVPVFGILLPVVILIVIFTFVTVLKILKTIAGRGASRQEIHQLNQSLQNMQKEIVEIKAQLADIIITLHDRV